LPRRIVQWLTPLVSDQSLTSQTMPDTTAAAELDALLPAILPSSLRFAATGDRAFKGEL
jgi:hypothetical protein